MRCFHVDLRTYNAQCLELAGFEMVTYQVYSKYVRLRTGRVFVVVTIIMHNEEIAVNVIITLTVE